MSNDPSQGPRQASSSQSQSQSQSQSTTQPSTSTMPPSPSLTLILAATPSLGIGKNGNLPWPLLKKEMGYFARVTKRVTTSPSPSGMRKVNAVLMGRKTWESIPAKLRPLRDRLNVVVTGSVERFEEREGLRGGKDGGGGGGGGGSGPGDERVEGPLVVPSIADGLAKIRSFSSSSSSSSFEVDRVFVIGGASIYSQALEMKECKRVLLTRIREEFECDTFFSGLEGEEWKETDKKKLREFTGEGEEVEGIVREGEVEFEFCLFERD